MLRKLEPAVLFREEIRNVWDKKVERDSRTTLRVSKELKTFCHRTWLGSFKVARKGKVVAEERKISG
jgi:hypothetical protein